jgi:hypothetical protein
MLLVIRASLPGHSAPAVYFLTALTGCQLMLGRISDEAKNAFNVAVTLLPGDHVVIKEL